MIKQFLAFLLLCALCFSLVACAVDAPTGPAQEKDTIQTATANGTGEPDPPAPPPGTGGGG
jgi:hypothetical protein